MPYTLALFWNTSAAMVGSPYLVISHLPSQGSPHQGCFDRENGHTSQVLLVRFGIQGERISHQKHSKPFPYTLALFWNTSAALVGSPCPVTPHCPSQGSPIWAVLAAIMAATVQCFRCGMTDKGEGYHIRSMVNHSHTP